MSSKFQYSLNIDFLKPQLKKFTNLVYKSLDEDTSFIGASLYVNNNILDLTGYTVMISVATSYGYTITDYANIIDAKNGLVEIGFKNNALCVGENCFEISLIKDGSVKISSQIGYRVLDSIGDEGDVSQESNYPILINLVKDINTSINRADRYSNTLSDKLVDIKDKTDKAVSATTDAINATNEANETISRVNSAIASGTHDLEVKEARESQDGTVYATLNERINAIENKPYILFETVEG